MDYILEIADLQAWAAMWRGLRGLANLGPRETEIIADTARRGIALNFEREQSPAGTPWQPLAKMTIRERQRGIDHRGIPFRVGGEHPILRRTGDLLRSFTDPDHPRNVTLVKRGDAGTDIELGAEDDPRTPHRIANLHAGGVTEDGHIIPPRPFVGLGDMAWRQVENQANRVLAQRVSRIG